METAASLNESGIVLTEANRPADAVLLFQRALLLEPKNPLLWFNIGIAFHRSGDYEAAIQSFERCRAYDDDNADAWASQALVLYELERFDEAEHLFEGALEREPRASRTWNNYGVLHFNEGRYEEARENFEKAVTMDPLYLDGLINLRDTCEELGDVRASEEFARRVEDLERRMR